VTKTGVKITAEILEKPASELEAIYEEKPNSAIGNN
jgi:hypothetical protein